jgi:hypothetical protein
MLPWTLHYSLPCGPETEKVDHLVSVHSRRLSMSLMPFTEWKKKELEEGHTMVLEVPESEGSYRDSTRRTKRQMKRLSSKLLVVNMEKSLHDKSKNIEVEPPLKLHQESRSQLRRIMPDEEERTDVKPKLSYMMVEQVRGIEEREERALDSNWT